MLNGIAAMMKLDDALQGVQRLGVDTAPVIYFIEMNPQYNALVTEIFQRISNGVLEGLCSVITLTEVLVRPLRQGDQQLARDYSDLLLQSHSISSQSQSIQRLPPRRQTFERVTICAFQMRFKSLPH